MSTSLLDDPFPTTQRLFIVILVGLGYALAFIDLASGGTPWPEPWKMVVVAISGVVYVALLFNEHRFMGDRRTRGKLLAYFAIQLALFTISVLLLGVVNGVWLIAMPLVGTAAATLSLWGLAAVSLYLLIILAWLPFQAVGWRTAMSIVASIAPAFLFVALFVRLLVREEDSRRRAEQLAAELEVANRELTASTTVAEELAVTQERNRLAREIHDSLGHYLTVINVQLQAALTVLDSDRPRAIGNIETAQELTQEGLDAVRQSVSTLRDSPLGGRSLEEAVAALAAETDTAGIVTRLAIEGQPRRLDPAAELALFRTAQEGLTNVRKHANASAGALTLDFTDDEQVTLTITDNGVGAGSVATGGYGLLGVTERVQATGGTTTTTTTPGQGFTLTVTVPG